MDKKPNGISKPNPPNYNDATFATDTIGHKRGRSTISGHNVWAVRFQRDGTVVDKNGALVSANMYVWPPKPATDDPRNGTEVRAITIYGGTGAVRYWKWNGSTFVPY
jgi:hypothetical protein